MLSCFAEKYLQHLVNINRKYIILLNFFSLISVYMQAVLLKYKMCWSINFNLLVNYFIIYIINTHQKVWKSKTSKDIV